MSDQAARLGPPDGLLSCPFCKVPAVCKIEDGKLHMDCPACKTWGGQIPMFASSLVRPVGDRGKCKGCGKEIWWVKHRNGAKAPYTGEGINHFIDCPKAKRFKT